MGELEQHEAEWLSLINYQLRIARAQVRQPPPLDALTISTLHDAVESMMSLAAEHLGATVKPRADFLQLFDSLDEALKTAGMPAVIAHRGPLGALNQARVGFKHHGNRPDSTTLMRHLANGEAFLADLCAAAFQVQLPQVSLLLFVRNEKSREQLKQATDSWAAGRQHDAMQELWTAFDELITDDEKRKAWHPGKSLFATKPGLLPSKLDFRQLGRAGEGIYNWLESLDRRVKMIAIGVDMRRYAYFEAHTPSGQRVMSGDVYFQWRPGMVVNDEVFERCFRFVIDTALELAEHDFSFDAWAARDATRPQDGPEV